MDDYSLTTSEVARFTGRSRVQVRRYGAARILASKIVGSGQRLFSLSDVERFIEERRGKGKGHRLRTKTFKISTAKDSNL